MRILKHLWGMMIVSGLICFLSCGDSNPGASDPDLTIPIVALLNAPEQLIIDNYSFTLDTRLRRDFMPTIPDYDPDGKPLIAVATVNEIDSLEIPDSFNITMMWVINGNKAWEISPERVYGYHVQPYQIKVYANGGPKWGPGIHVTVVVQLVNSDDDELYLLKTTDQYIGRTD